ncbi:MAG: NlpC/P60 family protein [Robiginitomaculum sp.]
MDKKISRVDILEEAQSWIGTPYQHQASAKGAGCDCLGLVRGIWRKFYGEEPIALPSYTPDWAEKRKQEALKTAADACLVPMDISAVQMGDIYLFRMISGVPAKHMAIAAEEGMIVHAYWGRSVTRSFFSPYWERRIAFAYSFPNLED